MFDPQRKKNPLRECLAASERVSHQSITDLSGCLCNAVQGVSLLFAFGGSYLSEVML